MKKGLKLICLTIMLLFVGIISTKAAVTTGSRKMIGYFGGADIFDYIFKVNGKDTYAYCHNPGISAYKDSDLTNGVLTLKTLRNVSDTVKNSRLQNVYDAGLMQIIASNCNDNNCYMARYIATNLYEHLFPMMNSNGNNKSSEISYIKYIINTKLLADKDFVNNLKKLAQSIGSYNVITSNMSGANNCSSNCDSLGQIDNAVALVKTAINSAVQYAARDDFSLTISNPIQNKNSENNNSGVFTYKSTVSYTVNILKFSDDKNEKFGSVYLNFNCQNCQNVNTKFYVNDNEVADITKENLVDYTENGSGAVRIKIEFTATSDKYKCDQINYTLGVTYTHYLITQSAYSVSKCSNSNKCQGFYVADTSTLSGTRTTSIDGNISLCVQDGEPSKCTAKIDNVECETCKENANEVDILEGYKYPNNNTCDTNGATLNIKECITNNGVDTTDHPYKNSELSEDTKIASAGVFCKEDYHLTLPGTKLQDSGRYFVLNSTIKGTETCYTSELKVSGAQSAITAQGNESVNAYNAVQKAKAIAACLDGSATCSLKRGVDRDPVSCGTRTLYDYLETSESDCNRRGGIFTPNPGSTAQVIPGGSGGGGGQTEPFGQCRVKREVPKYRYRAKITLTGIYNGYTYGCSTSSNSFDEDYYGEWGSCGQWVSENSESVVIEESAYQALLEEIGQKASFGKCTYGGGSSSKGDSWASCTYKNGTGFSAQLGLGSINSLLNSWNSAVGYDDSIIPNDFDDTPFDKGWKMNYNFDPDMYYWYQENYMKNAKTDMMEKYDKSLSDVSNKYCAGTVSDDYETCSTGWQEHPAYTTGSVCVCEESGCGKKSYVLSTTKYVKQSQNAEAKYVTPTQFYTVHPSGNVVAADQGKEIEGAVELPNGLPIELRTSGERNYVMWVKKLGEYYDKDSLGRLWGNSDSVVAKLLQNRETNKCNNPNSSLVYENNTAGTVHSLGVYVCKYDVNICSNVCKDPDNSTDGQWHCKDGEICDENKYKEECENNNDNSCKKPNESSDNKWHCKDGEVCDENKYKEECENNNDNSCKKPNESSDNKWHCKNGEVCDEDKYKEECEDPNSNTCKNPIITNGLYNYKIGETQYSNRTKEQYYKDCTSCDTSNGHPGPLSTGNGKYTFYNQSYDAGTDGLYENKTETERKTICCPDGNCPVTFKCTPVADTDGNITYYLDDSSTTEDSALFKSRCCPNGKCPVICKYCLYNKKLNAEFRPVTPEDLNPNDRNLGVNWSWEEPIDTSLELKAYVTTQEIQEDNEDIFDINWDHLGDDEPFAMKVKMDGKLINYIKDYNKGKNYANDTLKCYDHTIGDTVYKNIYCYSTFIDDLVEKYSSNIQFTIARPSGEKDRKNSQNLKYFTSWASGNWQVDTTVALSHRDDMSYYTNNFGLVFNTANDKLIDYHVGPSWK